MAIERLEWKILGFADRLILPQKILKFCASFPIYEIKEQEVPLEILNISRRENTGEKTCNNIVFFVKLDHNIRDQADQVTL